MLGSNFSFVRLWAMILKEGLHVVRDQATLGMIIGIPCIQLILFGFAINTNPRHLPTAVIDFDQSALTRSFIKKMENTNYFNFVYTNVSEAEADALLKKNKVLFVLRIPSGFTRAILRNQKPSLLIETDATDPVASGGAIANLNALVQTAFNESFKGTLAYLAPKQNAFESVVHARYNPLAITQYNIIPGLLGVILTSSMTIVSAMLLSREREKGTLENLLSTPIQPIEVLLGKIVPYFVIAYLQVSVILILDYFLFKVPILGSVGLLLICCFPFISANLAVGLTFSTLAKSQLQAVQGSMFFFLPSILLSGFMFPFLGMPYWAQCIGNMLPLTHFLLIVRGLLLKNLTVIELLSPLLAILLFMSVVIGISVIRFRKTMD